ncbi:unnamed protein product [Hydatigera taeniaeformis]|uniref:PHD-type domain-containing protein n=1 Tax=Hydatigena taeniaeformis TaxID=6205 RepID=A0A3P7FJR4_HYDTA|nr:unnamed protein product [Hydatigera taeniaeformis]
MDDLDDESDAEYVYDGTDDDVSDNSASSSEDGSGSSASDSDTGGDDSDSSIRIIGVSHAPDNFKEDSALKNAISVPSEAYPVNLSGSSMLLDSCSPHVSSDLSDRICMVCLCKQTNSNDEIIECDACKITVHEGWSLMLCDFLRLAQREGLLAEPAYEENPNDPFFAQCRQHTDKEVVAYRRVNYISTYNRCHLLRQLSEKKKKDAYSIDALEDFAATNNEKKSIFSLLDDRLKEKLEHFRRLYEIMLCKREAPYTRPNKVPVYLENSPVAMRMFMAKAMALSLPIDLTGGSAVTEAFKSLPPGCPLFCPDFINYVLEREKKIEDYTKRLSCLESTQRSLQSSDANISSNYNTLSTRLAESNAKLTANRSKVTYILECLSKILPDIKVSGDLAALLTPPEVVDVHTATVTDSNAVITGGSGGDGGIGGGDGVDTSVADGDGDVSGSGRVRVESSGRVRAVGGCSRQSRKRCRKEPATVAKRAKKATKESDVVLVSETCACPAVETSEARVENIFHQCSICNGYRDQHLLTTCETCKKAFHIGCLDPPLARVPKRSKLFAWQCCMCTVAVVPPGDAITVDVNAPRQLRRSTAPPVLATPPPLPPSLISTSAVAPVAVAPTPVKIVAPAPGPPPPIHSKRSSSSVRGRGKNRRARLGRPRRVEAEAYPCQMDTQDVVPAEAYPTTTICSSTPLVEAGSEGVEELSVSQQLRKVGYGEEGDEDDVEEDEGSYTDGGESSDSDSESDTVDNIKEKSSIPLNAYEDSLVKRNASDDELASLRGSKVKFVRIKDHESPDESLVDAAPQRYVICQSQDATPKKSPMSSNFKIKIRKSTNS